MLIIKNSKQLAELADENKNDEWFDFKVKDFEGEDFLKGKNLKGKNLCVIWT
jgi:hypothetical protein